jgi:hypothetical protein
MALKRPGAGGGAPIVGEVNAADARFHESTSK